MSYSAPLSDQSADITVARRVLEKEIEGLQALAGSLDHHFTELVAGIAALKGRVIITGMGKSGHIARKIAATLASTGTPALFVHPGEASHGDLGMITQEDWVIALSNSGETAELRAIIHYTRRFSIPLAAIVRRKESALVEAANIAFVLPEIPEATETNAPTTSTTMMLAFGDALAVALLERKGFNREDYSILHPGGKLGAAFTKVSDLMHKGDELPIAAPDQPMSEVLLTMTSKRFGCAAIEDTEGRLLGIITDGDLRRHMRHDLMIMTAKEVMTQNPVTIRPQALAVEAISLMSARAITALFVVDEGKIKGILHLHDCLRVGVV